jgi:hypothetical protein
LNCSFEKPGFISSRKFMYFSLGMWLYAPGTHVGVGARVDGVGTLVGAAVGIAVGSEVGAAVGAALGALVGVPVGIAPQLV